MISKERNLRVVSQPIVSKVSDRFGPKLQHLKNVASSAFAAVFAISLSGCATVDTRPLGSGKAGISYHLPSGKVRLRVIEAPGGLLSVLVDGPLVVGDPQERMIAKLPQSGVADNNVTITVDAKTNLLSKVDVTSTGKLTEILTNVAKSAVFLQGSDSEKGTTIYAGVFEPDQLPQASSKANIALQGYYSKLCGSIRKASDLPFAKELKQLGHKTEKDQTFVTNRLIRCRELNLQGASTAVADNLITISVDSPDPSISRREITQADREKCRTGICYRTYRPRSIDLKVRGAFQLSDVMLIPDPNILVYVPLPSGVFAEQKYTLTFTDGVLTSYQRNGKSELVGLAGLPAEIVKTILSAPAEALGLKQKNLEAQTNYLTALEKAAAQKQKTEESCRASPQFCTETAYKLIGGPLDNDSSSQTGPVADSDNPSGEQGESNQQGEGGIVPEAGG